MTVLLVGFNASTALHSYMNGMSKNKMKLQIGVVFCTIVLALLNFALAIM